jgi:hypothetical protein
VLPFHVPFDGADAGFDRATTWRSIRRLGGWKVWGGEPDQALGLAGLPQLVGGFGLDR